MRKLFLALVLMFSVVPVLYAAPPDENYTSGQNGRLLFQYPKNWIGGIIEDDGLVGLANSRETLEVAFDGGTPQAGQAAVAIFNEFYLQHEYELATEVESLETIATVLSEDTDDYTFTPIGETEIEGKTVFRVDGENSEGGAFILMIVDTGDGIAGLGLITAASQIREYELIAQTIAGSMDYLSEDEIGFEANAPLELTYTSLNDQALTFQYPKGAIITEQIGAVLIANREGFIDTDEPQKGDMMVAFFTESLFSSELSEAELGMTAEELMEFLRSTLVGGTIELSEVAEMTLGERTVFRTNIVDRSANFDSILLTIDTENGALAAMLVTSLGERELYEVLFFSIAETVDYRVIEE